MGVRQRFPCSACGASEDECIDRRGVVLAKKAIRGEDGAVERCCVGCLHESHFVDSEGWLLSPVEGAMK